MFVPSGHRATDSLCLIYHHTCLPRTHAVPGQVDAILYTFCPFFFIPAAAAHRRTCMYCMVLVARRAPATQTGCVKTAPSPSAYDRLLPFHTAT